MEPKNQSFKNPEQEDTEVAEFSTLYEEKMSQFIEGVLTQTEEKGGQSGRQLISGLVENFPESQRHPKVRTMKDIFTSQKQKKVQNTFGQGFSKGHRDKCLNASQQVNMQQNKKERPS